MCTGLTGKKTGVTLMNRAIVLPARPNRLDESDLSHKPCFQGCSDRRVEAVAEGHNIALMIDPAMTQADVLTALRDAQVALQEVFDKVEAGLITTKQGR